MNTKFSKWVWRWPHPTFSASYSYSSYVQLAFTVWSYNYSYSGSNRSRVPTVYCSLALPWLGIRHRCITVNAVKNVIIPSLLCCPSLQKFNYSKKFFANFQKRMLEVSSLAFHPFQHQRLGQQSSYSSSVLKIHHALGHISLRPETDTHFHTIICNENI